AYAVYITGVDAPATAPNQVVNNLVYDFITEGTIYAFYNSSSDNAQYYHNTISLDDQTLVGSDITRGFYQTTAATGLDFRNNVISITRSGTGDKHAIYLNTAGTVITSNNN